MKRQWPQIVNTIQRALILFTLRPVFILHLPYLQLHSHTHSLTRLTHSQVIILSKQSCEAEVSTINSSTRRQRARFFITITTTTGSSSGVGARTNIEYFRNLTCKDTSTITSICICTSSNIRISSSTSGCKGCYERSEKIFENIPALLATVCVRVCVSV